MDLRPRLRRMFTRGATKPSAARVADASSTRARPSPSSVHATPARLAHDLLVEFPDGVSDDVLAARAEAENLKPQTVGRVLERLRAGPRKATEIRRRKVDLSALEVIDLRGLPSVRTRIKGSAYSVNDAERAKYGGTEYLLVRETDNSTDPRAIAVYGKGHRVGYLSESRAASTSPLLAQLRGDAFRVVGTGTTTNSIILWVEVPRVDALRKFRADQ